LPARFRTPLFRTLFAISATGGSPSGATDLTKENHPYYNNNMVFFPKTEWARFVAGAYMVAALMGTFAFALADSFPGIDIGKDELSPGGIFAPIDYAVNYLAESSGATGKTGRNSFSPVRNNSLRVDMLSGFQKIETLFSYDSLRTIEETNHFDKKNTIFLKLRI
jgi:hypothetical protein